MRRLPRVTRLIGLLLVIAGLCGAGIGLYFDERRHEETKFVAGDANATNRIDLEVTIQTVDATNGDLVLRVLPDPVGSLADAGGSPARNLVIALPSSPTPELRFPAGQPIALHSVTVDIETSGIVTDYPFDHYRTTLAFGATVGGREVPIRMSLREVDPFFVASLRGRGSSPGVVFEDIRIRPRVSSTGSRMTTAGGLPRPPAPHPQPRSSPMMSA